jgi:hypothetical protein
MSELPHKPTYKLVMDRTNWKFVETNINVLTLAIAYQGVAFPILISMLDKRGNSHTQERIALINRYAALFGYETIDCMGARFQYGDWADGDFTTTDVVKFQALGFMQSPRGT